eukprot:m.309909 g.309909  ORF g.309909 m.309909 type:complete len:596 (+) comp23933_c0_seq1:81-1868(+)
MSIFAVIKNASGKLVVVKVYWYKTSIFVTQIVCIEQNETRAISCSEIDDRSEFRLVLADASATRLKTDKNEVASFPICQSRGFEVITNSSGKQVVIEKGPTKPSLAIMRYTHRRTSLEKCDYYSILGVERQASTDEIKRAYRDFALRYHPDKVVEEDRAHCLELFQFANVAYSCLRDPEQRKEYDRMIKGKTAAQLGFFTKAYWKEMYDSGRLGWLVLGLVSLGGGFAATVCTAGAALPLLLGVGGVVGGGSLGAGAGILKYTLSDDAVINGFDGATLFKYAFTHALLGVVAGVASGGLAFGMSGAFSSGTGFYAALESTQGAIWAASDHVAGDISSGRLTMLWKNGQKGLFFRELLKGILIGAAAGAAGGAVFGRFSDSLANVAGEFSTVDRKLLQEAFEAAIDHFNWAAKMGIKCGRAAAGKVTKLAAEHGLKLVLPCNTNVSGSEAVDSLDEQSNTLSIESCHSPRAGILHLRTSSQKFRMKVYFKTTTAPLVERCLESDIHNPVIQLPDDTDFPVTVKFYYSGSPIKAFDRNTGKYLEKKGHICMLEKDFCSRRFVVDKPLLCNARVARVYDEREVSLDFDEESETESTKA